MAQPLPLESQTLYAELLERLRSQAFARSFASLSGGFSEKRVSGQTYWYFKTSEGAQGQREFFVGPDTIEVRALMAATRRDRAEVEAEASATARLVAMLRAGGATFLDGPSGRVIQALAASGVFQLGGVLVGTQAFLVLGNLLGTRWSGGLRTQDIDVAALPRMEIALPHRQADVPAALESLQMGFLPVPGFDSRAPETSFKVRGKELRLDLVTPATGRRKAGPIRIPRFNTAAHPVEFLGYLMEAAVDAAALHAAASLVKVPDPARFALHKLILSERRPVTEQTKARKDRLQAEELLRVLQAERPGDLALAAAALRDHGKAWRVRAARAVRRLTDPPEGLLPILLD